MISKQTIAHIEARLSTQVSGWQPVGGGSINQAYCLQTKNDKYFIKINSKSRHPGMFEAEATGLQLMARTGTTAIPRVVLSGSAGDESFLALEWIDTHRPTCKAMTQFGHQLAQMHKNSAGYFGLDHNNYMGSLPQSNKPHETWSAFFINERLQPMVKMAADKHLLIESDISAFERLYKNLPGFFDEEPPSLVHGDLWSGNYLIGIDEKPYLIDPAVSFGRRESDIAISTLFGGFSDEFYGAYNETFPLGKGWENRIDLWNLYPLLVHLNLFGMAYLAQVRGCLRRYL